MSNYVFIDKKFMKLAVFKYHVILFQTKGVEVSEDIKAQLTAQHNKSQEPNVSRKKNLM